MLCSKPYTVRSKFKLTLKVMEDESRALPDCDNAWEYVSDIESCSRHGRIQRGDMGPDPPRNP